MLLRLFYDAGNVLRFRYFDLSHYRYSLAVYIGVLLLLGLINALGVLPLLGRDTTLVAMSVVLTALKCGVLALVAHWLLKTKQSKQPITAWFGFVLATEATTVPVLLIFYFPELAMLGGVWQGFIFVAQWIGFKHISQASLMKIFLMYLAYGVATLLISVLLFMAADMLGWIDAEVLNQKMQAVINNMQ